jgi:hypothetical protein
MLALRGEDGATPVLDRLRPFIRRDGRIALTPGGCQIGYMEHQILAVIN